jgi:hypothetical protein
MSGAVSPLLLYAFMSRAGTNLPFLWKFFECHVILLFEAPYAVKPQLIHGSPIVVFLYYPGGGSRKLTENSGNYTNLHDAITDKMQISTDVKHSVAPFLEETRSRSLKWKL